MNPVLGVARSIESISILSDNAHATMLLQQLFAMLPALPADSPRHVSCLDYSQFLSQPLPQAFKTTDLVILGQQFGGRPYLEIVQSLKPHTEAKILVLLDDASISQSVADLADAVRAGVDQFLSYGELSSNHLQRLLQVFEKTSVGQVPSSALATKSAAQSFTQEADDQLIQAEAPTGLAQHLFGTGVERHRDERVGDANLSGSELASNSDLAKNSLPDVISSSQELHQFSLDIINQKIHLSISGESQLGYDSARIIDLQTWLDSLSETSAKEFSQMLATATDMKVVPQQFNGAIKDSAGQMHNMQMTELQVKLDKQNQVIGANAQMAVSIVKTTPAVNKQAAQEEQLKASNLWFNVASSLPVFCLLLDENAIVVEVIKNSINDAGSHHADTFANVEVGATLTDVLGKDVTGSAKEAIKKTLNTGKSQQQTVSYAGSEGVRWFDSYFTKMQNLDGLSRHVLWTAIDITSSRQAYQELLKNHDALTDMLNDSPVIFCQKDSQGRYQRVNQAFCRAFNVNAEVIAGRTDSEVFSDELVPLMQSEDQSLLDSGKDAFFQHEQLINGELKQIYWQKFPICSLTTGKVDSIVGFAFILTEQQRLRQNVISGDEAKESEQSSPNVSQLVPPASTQRSFMQTGGMQQDVNDMIAAITRYSDLAMAQKNTARKQKIVDYIDQIVATGLHAKQLLEPAEQSVDDTVKPQAPPAQEQPAKDAAVPKEDGEFPPVQLKPLVLDIISMLRPTLPSSLIFSADVERSEAMAAIDPIGFQGIVMQLLNSTKDNANNDDTLTLGLHDQTFSQVQCASCHEPLDGDYIVLTVTTPSGNIEPEDLQKMVSAASQARVDGQSDNANIIALTHDNGGHVLVSLVDKHIEMQLLFKQAIGAAPTDTLQNSSSNSNLSEPSKEEPVDVVDD